VTLFRSMRRRAPQRAQEPPHVEPWPGMPPRPQRVQQPLREDSSRPPDLSLIPWQAAMSGPVDPRFDPCGYVLIEASASSEDGEVT
jgi:hypothetical protein